jgi:hypothetical protein
MGDPPRRQFNDDEDKDVPKPEVVRLEKITGSDRLRVVVQEGTPGLAARSGGAASFQIALDGAPGDGQAELQQLTPGCVRSPRSGFLSPVAG